MGLQMTSDCRAQVRQTGQIWIRMSGLAGWVRMKSARTLIGTGADVMVQSLLVPAQDP